MSAATDRARGSAEQGFWNTANGWAAIAQAEALERIAVALEARKPESDSSDHGVGGYGNQGR